MIHTATSTSTYTRTHTATHLADVILGSIADILGTLGIDPTRPLRRLGYRPTRDFELDF